MLQTACPKGMNLHPSCHRGAPADAAPPQLRHFYRSHRAATRAKLYVWRATEPDGGVPGQWLETARVYLRLALDSIGTANR